MAQTARSSLAMCWRFPASEGQIGKPERMRCVAGEVVEQGRGEENPRLPLQAQETVQEAARTSAGYTAVRITEIAFDGQKFKAPELPKKAA